MNSSYEDLNNVLVVIPVLNEEAAIAGVIRTLQSFNLQKIRVVDNGSCDRSAKRAIAAGAEIVDEPIPGYGRACWRGLQQLPSEIEWILFCDGDGSDDLSQLPEFFAQRTHYDLILGNRRATTAGRRAMTPVQNFGNALATTLIHWGWGQQYHDLGPLRLIRRAALEDIQMQDRGFGWTVEMQTRAIECGLRSHELPVGYRPRQGGRSKISGTLSGGIRAGTMILSTLGKLYWRRFLSPPLFPPSPCLWLSSLLLFLGCFWIIPHGDFLNQAEAVPNFWLGAGLMGLGFICSWRIRSLPGFWFWSVAILTRLLLLPMHPGDDVWRYIWEGYIQTWGFSPYDLPPSAPELALYRPEWWSQINFPEVSAIYPPIAQLGFRALAAISPSLGLFKIAIVGADLLICGLLSRRFGYRATLLYAWNPIVLYSFAGGAHYDSWFLLPLVAAWLLFDKPDSPLKENRDGNSTASRGTRGGRDRNILPMSMTSALRRSLAPPSTISSVKQQRSQRRDRLSCRWLGSALLVGVSVAVKWMSLPILSFLVWRALWPVRVRLALLTLLCGLLPLGLSAIPFCHTGECPLIPTGSFFVTHGRSAELIPHIVTQIWPPSRWENWLYAFPLCLAVIWLLLRARNFQEFAEWYLLSLVVISPIIHAWYFTWLTPFSVASRNLGTKLVSLSALVYFVLPYRKALGDYSWELSHQEHAWLWTPFILGVLWTVWRQNSKEIVP